MENVVLGKKNRPNLWLVQLVIGTKRKVTEISKDYPINLNGLNSKMNLNIIPLGSYDALIGMDWIEQHKVVLNCLDYFFTCANDEGVMYTLKWIPRAIQ